MFPQQSTYVKLTRLVFFRGRVRSSPRGLVNTITRCRTSAANWDLIHVAGLDMGWAMGRVQPLLRGPEEPQAPPRSKPSCWDSEGSVHGGFGPSGAPWGTLPWPGTTIFPYIILFSLHFATMKSAVGPRSSFDHLLPGDRKAFIALEYYTDTYSIPHPREGMENETGSFLLNDCSLLSR